MDDEVFVYKCPNCGGKVDYIDNKWHCSYCNNSYDALFATRENTPLPDYKNKPYELYGYFCNKCNKKFVSVDKENAKCPNCNEQIEGQGKYFTASNIMNLSVNYQSALSMYQEDISDYSEYNYFNEEPKLQYINCDLYNGFVKISYNDIKMKYIFVNLLIPNIDYEDYRFMYEVGNNGFQFSDIVSSDNQETKIGEFISSGEYLNSINDKKYEEDIVEECINDFLKKCNVSDKNLINVQRNFKVDDGFFIPFYISGYTVNNKTFHHYIFGSNNMSIIKKSFFNRVKFANTIIELPEEKNAHKKAKYYGLLSSIFQKISFFLFAISAFSVYANLGSGSSSTSNIPSKSEAIIHNYVIIGILTAIALFIVSFILYYIFYRKYNYYEKSICLTKEEYFEQIINNSNCVKIIKVKK